jgi:hypothetical protein
MARQIKVCYGYSVQRDTHVSSRYTYSLSIGPTMGHMVGHTFATVASYATENEAFDAAREAQARLNDT